MDREKDLTLAKELIQLMEKHDVKGYAWAITREGANSPAIGGYGAHYPKGTERDLIRKLNIMIRDIEHNGTNP